MKELEEKIVSKLDKHKHRMKSLQSKVDNMEDMLQQLLSLSKKKGSREGRSKTTTKVHDVEEDEEDAWDEEEFECCHWLMTPSISSDILCHVWPYSFIRLQITISGHP